MQTKEILACEIMEDDWFFLAGHLYRVGTVNVYETHDKIGIQFYDPHQGAPARFRYYNLDVYKDTHMTILNQ